MEWAQALSLSISTESPFMSALRRESSIYMTSLTSTPVSNFPFSILIAIFPVQQLMCVAKLADIEALQSGAKYLKQLIPAVVNLVYKKLLQYDITSRAFHTRTTVDETEQEQEWLDEDAPKIQRRKMFLRWYLTKLCQDPTSIDFWRYLSKVGYANQEHNRHIHMPS